MKRNEDFRNALGEPDEYFQQSVMDTLNQLNRQAERESRPKRSFSMRLVSSFAALALIIGGIVIAARNDHRDYLTPAPTSPVDITATAQSTVTPLASPPSIETEHAVLTFTEAVRDGSDVRITVDIRPKNEHTLALNANHLLSTSVQYVSDLYGIQPGSPEQTLYEWAVEHGFPKALAVDLNAPSDDTPGPVSRLWHIEKHTLREDGSAAMNIVGPAAESDIYDLEYHIVPWNMEDKGESFLPGLHDGGSIRLTLTDSTSHVPQLEVSGIKYPFSMSEEEYSRKAWGLSLAESYTDLMNNTDKRIGQVYCIKGVVQEVLSASPMRVLINTSEDGSSQPVIVESPSYRTFPWKAGEFYRIYADVSYMDDNIPVLTARYCHVDPPESKQECVDFDQAAVTIREAVTDGIAVYLSVEVQPKDDNCLVLAANSVAPSFHSPEAIGKKPDYDGQTVYQWAVEHGYQKLLQFDEIPLLDRFSHPFTFTGTEITENGASLINLVSDTVSDTDQYPLRLSLVPYDMDFFASSDGVASRLIAEELEEKDISLAISATDEAPVTLAEYISIADPDTGKSGGEITVSIIRTPLNVYCKLHRRENDGFDIIDCIFYRDHNHMAGSFRNIRYVFNREADKQNCIMIPVKELSDDMLENLPNTFQFYLATFPENGEEMSTSWYTLKKLDEAETETAAVKVLEAIADKDNVCFTVEVTPKAENCLVLNYDVVPATDSPEKIGRVPDNSSQTIGEWAAVHGYDKVIRVTLSSAAPAQTGYYSPSAEVMLDSRSNGTEPAENGSTILRATGKAISGLETYDLFCSLQLWDTGDEAQQSYLLEEITIPVRIPGANQEPLLIGKYRLASDPVNVDKMTVSIYRSQVSDYAEFRTKDRDYFFRHAHLLDESRDMNAYSGTVIHSISQEYEDDNTTYVYRLPCKLPEELPDTLIMAWSDRPDEPIVRVDTRTVEPDQTVTP